MRRFIRYLVFTYNQAGMVATLSGGSIVAVIGGVTGWVTSHTYWIAAYGPVAWWGATLLGALVALLLAIGFAHLRYKWASASAITKWKEKVDSINPLDNEFSKKRINIADVVSPIRKGIYGKRFVSCELIGPANIVVIDNIKLSHSRFSNCDVVVRKSGDSIYNGVALEGVDIYDCVFYEVTFFIPPNILHMFRGANYNFVGLTGDANIDKPQTGSLKTSFRL